MTIKNNVYACILMFLIVGIQSCSTDESNFHNEEGSELTTQISQEEAYTVENGMVHFKDFDAYTSLTNELSTMTVQEKIAWGEVHNIKTQEIILEEVGLAEDTFDELYFKGLDENLSEADLTRAGKPVAFSATYQEALKDGVIIQTIDQEHGGYGYELAVADKMAALVINKDGEVMIQDEVLKYTATGIEITSLSTGSKTHVASNSRTTECTNFTNGNIFTQDGVIWYYDSSNHRFKHYVYFNSCYSDSGVNTFSSQFYTEAIAERKRWGKWKIRNSYNPIVSISGNWSYYWTRYNTTTGITSYQYNNLSGGIASPFNFIVPGGPSNHVKLYLEANFGRRSIAAPYEVTSEVKISDYGITGIFEGETDNYSTYYHD